MNADLTKNRTTYFAFGSNLVVEQMEKRCPSASLLSIAELRGYRLDFAGWSPTWKGGVATITPRKNSVVLGALWSISLAELLRLDHFEGHPVIYRRVKVEVFTEDVGMVKAWTYRLSRESSAPSRNYLEAVLEGRAQLGVHDKDVVDAAVRADEREKERRARYAQWAREPSLRLSDGEHYGRGFSPAPARAKTNETFYAEDRYARISRAAEERGEQKRAEREPTQPDFTTKGWRR